MSENCVSLLNEYKDNKYIELKPIQPRIKITLRDGFKTLTTVTLSGRKLFATKILEVLDFHNGIARVRNKETELFHHIDINGKALYRDRFRTVSNFNSDGIAAVCNTYGEYYHINKKGKRIYKKPDTSNEYCRNFIGELAYILRDGKRYLIKKDGTIVNTNYKIYSSKSIDEKTHCVELDCRKIYILNNDGMIISSEYDRVTKEDDSSLVYKYIGINHNIYAYLDSRHNVLYKTRKAPYVVEFLDADGQLIIRRSNSENEYSILDIKSNMMFEWRNYEKIEYVSKSVYLVRETDGKSYHINEYGVRWYPEEYMSIEKSNIPGLAIVSKYNNLKYYIEIKGGKRISDKNYLGIIDYKDCEYATGIEACVDTVWESLGVFWHQWIIFDPYNKNKEYTTKLYIDPPVPSGKDLMMVRTSSRSLHHVSTINGKTICKEAYEDLSPYVDGYSIAKKNGKYFHIDTSGNTIYKHRYDELTMFNDKGIAEGRIFNKIFKINKKGKRVR